MSSSATALADGRSLLCALKAGAGHSGPQAGLLVGRPPKAFLRVVATQPGRIRTDDVQCLTEWRNRFVTAFLTEFNATNGQTERWLSDTIGPADSKILFMLDAPDGKTLGYMGLAFIDWDKGYGEADAIVRGGLAEPGVMSDALRVLLSWARLALGLAQLGVRVRSDNPALAFYVKLGFVEQFRVPLRRSETPGKTVWIEDPSLGVGLGSPSLVHLLSPAQPDTLSR